MKKNFNKIVLALLAATVSASFSSVTAFAQEPVVTEQSEAGSVDETEAAEPVKETEKAANEGDIIESPIQETEVYAQEEAVSEGGQEESPIQEEETSAQGSTSSSFGNIYMDLDGDGDTDKDDEGILGDVVQNYNMKDHGGQEISSELSRILYGPLKSDGSVEEQEYSSYYLNNAGTATPVRSQGSNGTCWAFSGVSSLESAILKERLKVAGVDESDVDMSKPVLEGLENKSDISEKYLAFLAYDRSINDGAQDEGVSSKIAYEELMNAGGFFGFPDGLFSAWRGVVSEEEEPYMADNASDDYLESKLEITRDGLPERWSISDKTHVTGDINAPARVNKVISLPSPAVIEYKDGKNVWTSYDEGATALIKKTLVENGAVGISYAADQSMLRASGNSDFFNYENWSQYNDSDEATTNHAVSIVGWDDNYPAEKFKADKNGLPPADGAWLVKNSWGSYDYYKEKFGASFTNYADEEEEDREWITWGIPGENGIGTGYFRLSYYDKTISSAVAFGVDIPDDGWDYDNIYQYNFFTDLARTPLVLRMYDKETAVANIFTAHSEETLEAVSVRTTQLNSRVNVKVYLLDGSDDISDPTEGELVSELTRDIANAGFTTLELKKPVALKPGMRFAVVENVTADAGHENSSVSFLNVETALAADKQTDESMGLARSYVHADAGQTYAKVLTEGAYSWMSPELLTSSIGGGFFKFGNALIKAFTTTIREAAEDASDNASEDHDDKSDGIPRTEQALPRNDSAAPHSGQGVSESSVNQAQGASESSVIPNRGASAPSVRNPQVASATLPPKTGDSHSLYAWTALSAAMGIVIFTIIKKRKNGRND